MNGDYWPVLKIAPSLCPLTLWYKQPPTVPAFHRLSSFWILSSEFYREPIQSTSPQPCSGMSEFWEWKQFFPMETQWPLGYRPLVFLLHKFVRHILTCQKISKTQPWCYITVICLKWPSHIIRWKLFLTLFLSPTSSKLLCLVQVLNNLS